MDRIKVISKNEKQKTITLEIVVSLRPFEACLFKFYEVGFDEMAAAKSDTLSLWYFCLKRFVHNDLYFPLISFKPARCPKSVPFGSLPKYYGAKKMKEIAVDAGFDFYNCFNF